MKNSDKSIKTYMTNARRAMDIAYIMYKADPSSVRVHISGGNDKIGPTSNISMLPVFTCGNCAGCRRYCYAIRICHYSKTAALPAWAENTVIYRHDPERYFREIREYLTIHGGGFFRWHVGGEIPDQYYFRNMVKIAQDFKTWHFWCYTKMYDIANSIRVYPKNFVVMYSKWEGMQMNNPYGRPEFRTRLKGMPEAPFKGLWHCDGNCIKCIMQRRGCVVGETTYNDEH
jgi:hypothetical protein